jgi:type IV pilus assembly protein PilA
MKHNSKSGFSLVELMVVVAIIGILATIAVPNFQRFQARAKQTSARTELSGIYTAQKSFHVEYSSFTRDLQIAGFVPEGIRLPNPPVALNRNQVIDINRIYGSSMGAVPAVGATSAVPAVAGTAAAMITGFAAGAVGLSANDMGCWTVCSICCGRCLARKCYRL